MNKTMELLNAGNAYHYLIRYLWSQGYRHRNMIPINKGRYFIVIGEKGHRNVFVMFKKEWFLKFGELLKDQGAKGIGDTINCEDLKECLRYKVKDIYCIYVDGKIYTMPFKKFLNESKKWENKEGKEVRSTSIHFYERANPEQ